jgi:general nucleoside transport system permease protein
MNLRLSENTKEKLKRQLTDLSYTSLATVLAVVVGGIFLALLKVNPFQAYGIIFSNSLSNFGQVLRRTTVYICTGLAVAIPIKTGVFNLGGEGQVAAGALAGAVIGSAIALPAGIHPIVCILVSMMVGAALASISAFMKVRFGSSEVVTGFMINYIMLYVLQYLTQYTFIGSSESSQTAPVLLTAKIARVYPGAQWSFGLFIAIGVCILLTIIMDRTRFGLEMKSAGMNPLAAKFQGVNIKTMSVISLMIGGALAGLGGSLEVIGGKYTYLSGYFANYGYDGIAVAYMARNNPIGIIITSLIISMLKVGAIALDRQTIISSNYVFALQGIIITLLVSPYVVQLLVERFKKHKKGETSLAIKGN